MNLDDKIAATVAVLREATEQYQNVCFANSLGAEDMVLTDLIAQHALNIAPFSLDTGRLPAETYDLIAELGNRYTLKLKLYFPDHSLVEEYVARHGINGFYNSVEERKGCCFVRKVEPLRRALTGKDAWITGMRRDQAVTRGSLSASEWDAAHSLQKFNPLIEWTNAEIWQYIRAHDVPYNQLHDQFYPSIGCAPCTRAISAGEDIRAGRWWWESAEHKECGLHLAGKG
jgi:phosphoadenosine phosphosulfate reductase